MINIGITDGTLESIGFTADNTSEKSSGDQLGKDAFLQLLVAQMKNQDPLQPTSNQEYISELTQFSVLEEIQNLSSVMNNTNAFSLVGKNVIVQPGISSGETVSDKVGGYVEFVQITEGKAQVSIGGVLYDADDVINVVDDEYLSVILGGSNNESADDTVGDEEDASADENIE